MTIVHTFQKLEKNTLEISDYSYILLREKSEYLVVIFLIFLVSEEKPFQSA